VREVCYGHYYSVAHGHLLRAPRSSHFAPSSSVDVPIARCELIGCHFDYKALHDVAVPIVALHDFVVQ